MKSGQMAVKTKDRAVVSPQGLEKAVAVKEAVVKRREPGPGAGNQVAVQVNDLFQLPPPPSPLPPGEGACIVVLQL